MRNFLASALAACRLPLDLRQLLTGLIEPTGMGLLVATAPFRDTSQRASVALAIEIEGEQFDFTARGDGVFEDRVEIFVCVLRDNGQLVAQKWLGLDLALSDESCRVVKTSGVRANPSLSLAPGRYCLHVAARELGGRGLGVTHCHVNVPDFRAEPLMISGILLTAATAQLMYTVDTDPWVGKSLPGPVTSRRHFVQGDMLAVFAEIYVNRSPSAQAKVSVATRLIRKNGEDVALPCKPYGDASHSENRQPYLMHLPLRRVSPGPYVVRVEASLSGPDCLPAMTFRELDVTIRPSSWCE